jgi:hypothetical protein
VKYQPSTKWLLLLAAVLATLLTWWTASTARPRPARPQPAPPSDTVEFEIVE